MADVTLAEYCDNVWLVRGENHIDDLLANTLPAHVTIEIITCESKSQIDDLWEEHCAPLGFTFGPWLIHPAIVNRIRRAGSGFTVNFAPWSAQLSDQAAELVKGAAEALRDASGDVILTDFIEDSAPAFAADLARVRLGMIEQILIAAGVDAARLSHARRDAAAAQAVGQDANRVDIAGAPAD